MAITPIRIIPGGSGSDAIGQLLGTGINVLQQSLNTAVTQGRAAADLQFRQEQDVLEERERIDKRNERRDLELRRRFEADRVFDESVLQDRRDFAEETRRFGVTTGLASRKLGLSERQFEEVTLPTFQEIALPQAEEALRGAAQEREFRAGDRPLDILERFSNIERNLRSGGSKGLGDAGAARLLSLFQPSGDATTVDRKALTENQPQQPNILTGGQSAEQSVQDLLSEELQDDLFDDSAGKPLSEEVRGIIEESGFGFKGGSLDPVAIPSENPLLPPLPGEGVSVLTDRLATFDVEELERMLSNDAAVRAILQMGGRTAYDQIVDDLAKKRAARERLRGRTSSPASRISVQTADGTSLLNPDGGGGEASGLLGLPQ